MEEKKSNQTLWIIAGVALFLCCLLIALGGIGGYLLFRADSNTPSPVTLPAADSSTATPAPEVTRPPAGAVSNFTLEALKNTLVPENDPYQLACELAKVCDVPRSVPAKAYKIGDMEKFWVSNSDTAENSQINATLMYETPHSYFWVEEGTKVNEADMKKLMDTFENKIYPTDREFFGNEFNPGIDNDPHIYVIYATSIGHNIAGYFNSSDSFNPLVNEYSNAHETYVLGTSQALSDEYTYGVLAHEFVHMIQFPTDRNDVSWLSEGFAELGVFLNGYDVGGKYWDYYDNTDLQLNTWEDNSSPDFGAHYGASFLFFNYFLDRFGKEATQALNSNPENDMQSVDDTLQALNITDALTGKPITADDVTLDWMIANYLQDAAVADGRYAYKNNPSLPNARATETLSACPQAPLSRTVHQYGADYIQIQCAGNYTLSFSGATATGLLPAESYSGKYAFWSNRGDESDMTLTRQFDFTQVSAPISMKYRAWYDIEEDWDYLYVEVSEDGKNWTMLKTPSGTDTDPSGNSYGWGYTGATNGWIEESVDLSAYAGKQAFVRFQYVTDAAVNGQGFLLDDVNVEAAKYFSDFETDAGGWEAAGFVRVENALPQTFRLALIVNHQDVRLIELNADQTAQIPLALKAGDSATLVVTGATRFTRETAAYQIEIK
ncbi:MAG: immune inhibitor A [Anaerolineales bacterium]